MSPHLHDPIQELADENAMDVFHHPYAYAAWRGVPTRPALALAGQT